jgi:hypothetical protein
LSNKIEIERQEVEEAVGRNVEKAEQLGPDL